MPAKSVTMATTLTSIRADEIVPRGDITPDVTHLFDIAVFPLGPARRWAKW